MKKYIHVKYLSAFYLIEESEFLEKPHYSRYEVIDACMAEPPMPVTVSIAHAKDRAKLTIGEINSDIHGRNVVVRSIMPYTELNKRGNWTN